MRADGSAPAVLLASALDPAGLALDGTSLYYVDTTAGTLTRCAKDGSAVKVLASSLDAPVELAIDSSSVYLTSYGSSATNGSVVKIAK